MAPDWMKKKIYKIKKKQKMKFKYEMKERMRWKNDMKERMIWKKEWYERKNQGKNAMNESKNKRKEKE